MSLVMIMIFGICLQKIADKLKLPSLIFFLVCGMFMGPFGFNVLSATFLSYSPELRNAALVIILLRAGLGLSMGELKKVGRPALLMSCIPGIFEGLAIAVMAVLLLGLSFNEGGMLGFIIAAVSPAVVVPMMIKLEQTKLGTDKGIPSLILAGASLDDVVAITIFSVFAGLYLGGENSIIMSFLMIPVRIILGVGLGLVVGRIMGKINKVPTLILLVIALGMSKLEAVLPLAALMAVMTYGFGINQQNPKLANQANTVLTKLWYFAQMILFMLVGASFDPSQAVQAGWVGVVVILVGLVFRTIGVYVSLIKTNLNTKERLFCAIAYLPKATVQAAMGGVPLAMGIASGSMILAISVLAILITTPLGAILMTTSAQKLLRSEI